MNVKHQTDTKAAALVCALFASEKAKVGRLENSPKRKRLANRTRSERELAATIARCGRRSGLFCRSLAGR